MIIYSPTDGDALTSAIPSMPRNCFLITKLGKSLPPEVLRMRRLVTELSAAHELAIIDATHKVTGRDILNKIWRLIAGCPISIALCHESFPPKTLANIYFELGVAQAMGKETVMVKSPGFEVASDLVRTEYIEFDDDFDDRFTRFLEEIDERASHYEMMAEQLERNPILALDYLKRAFLLTEDQGLRERASELLQDANVTDRAKNSVEVLAATF